MGAEFVVIFISVILLFCGLVLLMGSGESGGRKVGVYMLMIGLIGIFISIIAYPSDKRYIPTNQYNSSY